MSNMIEIKNINGYPLADEAARKQADGIAGELENKQPKGDYALKNEIPSSIVHYTEQTLTADQQAQARQNIGAAGAEEMASLGGKVAALFKDVADIDERVGTLEASKPIAVTATHVMAHIAGCREGEALRVVSDIPYTAEGVTELTLKHYGKNLLALPYFRGDAGQKYTNNGVTYTILEDGRVHCKGTGGAGNSFFQFGAYPNLFTRGLLSTSVYPNYITDGYLTVNDGVNDDSAGIYTSTNPNNNQCYIQINAGVTVDMTLSSQLEVGTKPTVYEPGRRTEYVAKFGQAVHGGSYDWQTGTLTVTHDASGALAEPYTLAFAPTAIPAYAGQNNLYTGIGENTVTAIVYPNAETEFDASGYGLPVLYLYGDVSAMDKDNAVTLDYVYGARTGTCNCKWQGSSSLSYPKKNYTVKFDKAFEAASGWGAEKKYCFKANYIDPSHTRNVVSAKLWGQIVKSRAGAPDVLAALPNGGAVDGFPCAIILNDRFHGLYTWNIPKDGWMFGMGEGEREAILCAEGKSTLGSWFRAPAVDGDFELEYATDEDNADWVMTSLNTLISACIASDGSDLDTTVAQYLDWESAIDYMAYIALLGAHDCANKNYILATFDGTKWYFSAYDLDSTWGLWWNGKEFIAASNERCTIAYLTQYHRVMELIANYKKDEFKARYAELRRTVLSEDNVALSFGNFAMGIPASVQAADWSSWPEIPGTSVNSVAQVRDWYRLRCRIIDAEVEAM